MVVCSGRALSDLRERVPVDDVGLVGNHGIELALNRKRRVAPAATEARDAVATVHDRLTETVEGVPGARLEDKGASLTVHVRATPADRVPAVENAVARAVDEVAGVGLVTGKAVFEVRPAVALDKGTAMTRLEDDVPAGWTTVYVGDDTTDEDAFRAVQPDGVGVYVAGRDGTVLTLDGRDGTEQWRRSVGDLAAAPSVVGGRVFVATGDGLVALAASDGSVQWRVETPERADFVDPAGRLVDAAVMVHEGGIYTVAGEDSPAVVRRSLADGSEDWRTEIAEPWALPIFASGEGEVFVSSGPHDTRFWQLDAATGDLLAEEPRYGHDFPTEAFYADGSVYTVEPFFGSAGRTPLDEGTGWTTDVPPGGELADGDGRVYYATSADDAGVFALSKTDGAIDWEVEPPGDVVGRPVVAGDVVVVPTDAGLYGVAPSDGSDRWLRPGDATGEDALAADDLVFSTREGAVRAFRAP